MQAQATPGGADGQDEPAAAQRSADDPAGFLDRVSYATSPPRHPELAWPALAERIAQARQELVGLSPVLVPPGPVDPLAERASSAQRRAVAVARRRAAVHRAEAARLVATGRIDAAADELAEALAVARQLARWGEPVAAQASAEVIEMVLDALAQPAAAPLQRALGPRARGRLAEALQTLDRQDPAGRLRAVVESVGRRQRALARAARGPDGPTVVRRAARRLVHDAARADARTIERLADEAQAFATALADAWDKPTRSAVVARLADRQGQDTTGVLVLLLGDAARACEDDASLRPRLQRAIEALR
ncbi:MAG: hypothetical protein KatS3mg103_0602 [Phycisphaerales bacterium]|nr:MAG: hypothetical protein KatS3mg103_0602 [Phycisphaerales bacterium]